MSGMGPPIPLRLWLISAKKHDGPWHLATHGAKEKEGKKAWSKNHEIVRTRLSGLLWFLRLSSKTNHLWKEKLSRNKADFSPMEDNVETTNLTFCQPLTLSIIGQLCILMPSVTAVHPRNSMLRIKSVSELLGRAPTAPTMLFCND